jgi:hypothetical protein
MQKFKNEVKELEEFQVDTDHTYGFLMNILKKSSILPTFMNLHMKMIAITGFQNIMHMPL